MSDVHILLSQQVRPTACLMDLDFLRLATRVWVGIWNYILSKENTLFVGPCYQESSWWSWCKTTQTSLPHLTTVLPFRPNHRHYEVSIQNHSLRTAEKLFFLGAVHSSIDWKQSLFDGWQMTGKSSKLSSPRQHTMETLQTPAGVWSTTKSKQKSCGWPVRMPEVIMDCWTIWANSSARNWICLKIKALCCYTLRILQDRNGICPSSKDCYLFTFKSCNELWATEEQALEKEPSEQKEPGSCMFLCYLLHVERSGSQVSASWPCVFQLHPIRDCEALLLVPRSTGKWTRHAFNCTVICHDPKMQWFAGMWFRGWNGLAVPCTTEPFSWHNRSSCCFFGLWSILVPFTLGSLCLSV